MKFDEVEPFYLAGKTIYRRGVSCVSYRKEKSDQLALVFYGQSRMGYEIIDLEDKKMDDWEVVE